MIYHESHSDHGTVGTSPAPLSAINFPAYDGVVVRADDNNAGVVKVGSVADINAGRGYPLAAGQSLKIKINSTAKLRVVASQASQAYTWMAV